MKFLLSFSLLLSSFAFPSSDNVLLRIKVEKGQTFIQEVVMEQDINQTIQGMEQNIQQTMGFTFKLEISEVDVEGNARIDITYHRVVFKQNGPMGDIVFDSEQKEEPHPMAMGFDAMVGLGLEIVLSPRGTLLDFLGADSMIEQLIAKLDLPEGPALEQMKASFKNQFGDEALKSMFQGAWPAFPEAALAIGDRWQDNSEIGGALPFQLETSYQLISTEGDRVNLAVSGNMSPLEGKPLDMGGEKMKFNLSGTQVGTMTIHRGTGLVHSSELTQDLEGAMVLENMNNMEVPMKLKSKIMISTKGL